MISWGYSHKQKPSHATVVNWKQFMFWYVLEITVSDLVYKKVAKNAQISFLGWDGLFGTIVLMGLIIYATVIN